MSSPWPKHAKLAVMLTFDFDAESGWLSRDPAHKDRPGVLSQGVYGAKVGVPRLLMLRKLSRFIKKHKGVWWTSGARGGPALTRAGAVTAGDTR